MVTLHELKEAIKELESTGGDKNIVSYIDDAIANLNTASEALNTISVCGRRSVDALLGIMMGVDMILGVEGNNVGDS